MTPAELRAAELAAVDQEQLRLMNAALAPMIARHHAIMQRSHAPMTPAELRQARLDLGLTLAAMATAAGIANLRTIQRYERGHYPIPGPVAALVRLWLAHPDTAPPRRRPALERAPERAP